MRVLVDVEDEGDTREVVEDALGRSGRETMLARDRADAHAALGGVTFNESPSSQL